MEILTTKELDALVTNDLHECKNINEEFGKRFNYSFVQSLSEEQLKYIMATFNINTDKDEKFKEFMSNDFFGCIMTRVIEIYMNRNNIRSKENRGGMK